MNLVTIFPTAAILIFLNAPLLCQEKQVYLYSSRDSNGYVSYLKSTNPPSVMKAKGYTLIGTIVQNTKQASEDLIFNNDSASQTNQSNQSTQNNQDTQSKQHPNKPAKKPSEFVEDFIRFTEQAAESTGISQKIAKELSNLPIKKPDVKNGETPFDHIPKSFEHMIKVLKEASFTLIDMELPKTVAEIPESKPKQQTNNQSVKRQRKTTQQKQQK